MRRLPLYHPGHKPVFMRTRTLSECRAPARPLLRRCVAVHASAGQQQKISVEKLSEDRLKVCGGMSDGRRNMLHA